MVCEKFKIKNKNAEQATALAEQKYKDFEFVLEKGSVPLPF